MTARGHGESADRVARLELAAVTPPSELPAAATEGERRIAWLRLAVVPGKSLAY